MTKRDDILVEEVARYIASRSRFSQFGSCIDIAEGVLEKIDELGALKPRPAIERLRNAAIEAQNKRLANATQVEEV